MMWANLIGNLAILAWVCTWVAEPGMLWLDLAGLVSWFAILVIEIRRDFGAKA